MIELKKINIQNTHEAIKNGKYSVRELVDEYLKVIKQKEDLNVFRGLFVGIDEQVEIAEKMFANGTATLMTGIPVALKDNLLVNSEAVGASSKILDGYMATYDATVVSRLRAAGAILVGRTNMDEFAMGGSTENSAYGVTKNPIDISRVPGGSSGGSAAAVAANMSIVALGTDTGGSIRQPASFCGIVGLKPTYGAVSRYGAIAMGSSLDQIGPFGKRVGDTKILFDFIKGLDSLDATTETSAVETADKNPKKIGVPYDFVRREGVDAEVLKNFEETVDKLKTVGYEIVDVSLPYLHYALSVYYILMPAEVSSNLARYDGIRYGLQASGKDGIAVYENSRAQGFGPEVRRRILLGTYILSHGYYDAYYNKANIVRNKIKEQYNKAFEDVSVILTPTTPTTAFKIGEKSNDPLAMYLADIFTVPANIAGVPAISVPSGFDSAGLPFGVQFVGPDFCEDRLFAIAQTLEDLVQ